MSANRSAETRADSADSPDGNPALHWFSDVDLRVSQFLTEGTRRPPPFLLGAALLFWGWQAGLLLPGILMGLILELPRWSTARWEFTHDDFARIWTFCAVLFLASIVYAFADSGGPAAFAGLYEDLNLRAQARAGAASARTAASIIAWLPMVFFLFYGAQVYSTGGGVPLETISLLLRRRWKKARKAGRALPASRIIDISWVYFSLALFGGSIQNGDRTSFFWGLTAILIWALWSQRSIRFSIATWAATLSVAIGIGYAGQFSFSQLQRYLENVNPQWFSGLARGGSDASHARTALGQIGNLKLSDRIVLRLETEDKAEPPALLREASYRSFKAQAWYAGLARNEFENVKPEPNLTSFTLIPGKVAPFSLKIACYLNRGRDLLPLPEGTGRLDDLPAFVVQKSPLGAVLAEGPGLVIFQASYGPGVTVDAPPDATEDLEIPARERPAIEQIAAELKLDSIPSFKEKLKAIEALLAGQYSYSTWQSGGDDAQDTSPIARFLLRTKQGHCEYFATATVLLCRAARIPARYAVGFAVHEGKDGNYVVRLRDGHAWCIVWNEERQRWQSLDTTPAVWVEAEAGKASLLRLLKDGLSRAWFEFSKLRWGQTPLRQYILYALIPVLALLLYQIIFRRRRRARGAVAPKRARLIWPGQDSEFYQLERRIAALGLPRGDHETASDWIRRTLREPPVTKAAPALREVLRLHYRYRFDPRGLPPEDRAALREHASKATAAL